MTTSNTPQDISTDVLIEKYAKNGETSSEQIYRRVATAIAKVEKKKDRDKWAAIFESNMHQGALGAGRIMSAAGTDIQATLINCFVQPVGDSMDGIDEDGLPGIYKALSMAAETMRRGGGVGYNFSPIRPKGSLVKSTQSEASGPCSYMNVYDKSCETVESAGARRGAQMGVLSISHPDIFEFVQAKRTEGRWKNFNVSVGMTNAFMTAVGLEASWKLVHKAKPGKKQIEAGAYLGEDGLWVYQVIKAKELYDMIMKSTYDYAEPGIVFLDNMNTDNNLHYAETINTTNPCAEQPLPAYGCCDLGPLVLTSFITGAFTAEAAFNWVLFEKSVAIHVRFLDNVLDATYWPLPEQKKESASKRRIGVGYTGLGDALIMMCIKYDTEEALEFGAQIAKSMRNSAYLASSQLAIERGSFPLFNADLYLQEGTCASRLPDLIKDHIRKHGIRNSHLLSIAPVGTISLAFADNVSNGIEPAFSWSYTRKKRMADGSNKFYTVVDHAFREYLKTLEIGFAEALLLAVTEGRSNFQINNFDYRVKHVLPSYFISALEISATSHMRMLEVTQPYIDSSISKTVNIPADYPFEDFKNLYHQAWKANLKGLATYRPNLILGSVLSAPGDAAKTAPQIPLDVDPVTKLILKRPEGRLEATSNRIKYMTSSGEQSVYIIVAYTEVDGVINGKKIKVTRPIEVFIPDSQMDAPHELIATISRQWSLNARAGILATALQDARQVRSPTGPVRYDWITKTDGSKVPLWHQSDIGVIAYAIQQMLYHDGFLDAHGNQIPSEVLALTFEKSLVPSVHLSIEETLVEDSASLTHGKICPECGAHALIKKDGCTFCTSCGYQGSCG